MTTLANRPNTALVVIDVQNGVVGEAYEKDSIIANVRTLIDKARSSGTPVVWVQHNAKGLEADTEPWQYVPELVRDANEPLVQKRYGDSFEDTDLEQVFAERGIGRLFVSGAQTDECIRSTLHGAFTRGYDTVLVSDAHTTEDLTEWGAPAPGQVIAHTNMYWAGHRGPGRTAGIVTTDEVDFTSKPEEGPEATS